MYICKQADFKQVISGKWWREPCFEFKSKRRVVWTTSENQNDHLTYYKSVTEEQMNV